MKKLAIKDLIEFRKKSDRWKKAFVENMKSPKIPIPTKGGGDYWIPSLSAICNSFRQDNLSLTNDKIFELNEKLSNTRRKITKDMYLRNIANLENYKTLDLKKLRPIETISFLKKSSGNPILTIKGLQIETKPSHIFTFGNKEEEKVGAIWFTSIVNGYTEEEVGMFCEMLFRFLQHNYSKKYQLSPKYCIAIDIVSGRTIDYSEIKNGTVPPLLGLTLDQVNRLM